MIFQLGNNPNNSNNIQNYILTKIKQKKYYSYNPNDNNIKYLLLLACHCNTSYKLDTIKNNLEYLNYESINILLINSKNLKFNEELKQVCNNYKNVTYYECDNMPTYDFGKWIFGLNLVDINEYKFTIFTNDSFIIHNSINHFINLTYKNNVELFGYNDSSQNGFHYQSYLFSIKNDCIYKFINLYDLKKNKINNQQDVINNYELRMSHYFKTKSCFLSIANIPFHRTKNIFFTSDFLYNILKKTHLLPFTKLKRIY